MDPATIFTGITALKDVLDLAREINKGERTSAPRRRSKSFNTSQGGPFLGWRESKPARAQTPKVESEAYEAAAKLNQIIDDQLLRTLVENIDAAKNRLNEALKDPTNSTQARDQEMKVASASICTELKRIYTLNGRKVFPAPFFENLWISFGCTPRVIAVPGHSH